MFLKQLNFFGKTGTSNKALDNWYIFYDGRYLGAIWVGLETNRAESHLYLSGSSTAFVVFQNFYTSRGLRMQELRCPNVWEEIQTEIHGTEQ